MQGSCVTLDVSSNFKVFSQSHRSPSPSVALYSTLVIHLPSSIPRPSVLESLDYFAEIPARPPDELLPQLELKLSYLAARLCLKG